MAGHTDALEERCAQFSQGDLDGALDLWTDDFVWEGPTAEGLPGAGRHEGKQQAVGVLQQVVGSWDSFSLTPDEYVSTRLQILTDPLVTGRLLGVA